ncbi:MAG: VWA domain-containing protein, partial [Catenulispora sp.]|nr:VWA domain-containing protein [Catenulispora sp.]
RLRGAGHDLVASASLSELLAAADTVDAIRLGHVAGIDPAELDAALDLSELTSTLDTAAVGRLEGLRGSDDATDARTVAALALRAARVGGELRLDAALRTLETDGSPLVAGAASGARALIGTLDADRLGARAAGWIDAAVDAEARATLRRRLTGLLTAAEPLCASAPEVLDPLADRIESLPDDVFLARLPALRGGFAAVSPAGRDRMLAAVEQRIGKRVRGLGAAEIGPEALQAATLADRAGAAALEAAGIIIDAAAASQTSVSPSNNTLPSISTLPSSSTPPSTLPPEIRWRLLLGREQSTLPAATRRYAQALDELYGHGHGEGAAHDHGGGSERPYPTVRDWSEDLAELFGVSVREEVLGQAAAAGRLDAVAELDPAAVRPSVELLRDVLSLAGGLPESAVAKLRPLVKRIVDQLAAELAHRMRPALTGLASPRPTSRPSGALDLPRTIRANLATARRGPDGTVTLLPERAVFHTRARRESDWRVILVVDVSGSMESSVIWSALTAAVFAAVPALTTHFLAFSTEVVDLTDRAADPLSLLLEVRVGGGTHIAAGLAAARTLVKVPSRTMVVLVSDFEEGAPLGALLAEVRRLAESGCTLLGCASLDDAGRPRYSTGTAGALVAAGMPVAALSPTELAAWVGEKVRSR